MSIKWTSVSDDYALSSDDQVRISISFNCAPLSRITPEDVKNFFGQQQAVKSVLDVTDGWVDKITLGLAMSCSYLVTVNPQIGVSAGDLRNQMYTALNQANATHVIKSDEVLVGTIEVAHTSIVPDAPAATTTISLVAIAALAIVALTVFLKID